MSCRSISRIPATSARIIINPINTSRKMAFFPHVFVGPHPATSFNPLFRLLEDFDESFSRGPRHHPRRQFVPRFDVKELEETYEVVGDLPGLDHNDIEIEFPDDETLTIRRRVAESKPAAVPAQSEKAAEVADEKEWTEVNNHHATVEDEEAPAATPATEATATEAAPEPQAPKARHWLSERRAGSFERTFRLPARVDVEAVTATMKNGSLTVSVPKAKKPESRKIEIN